MKLFNVTQMREIDRLTMEDYKIPGIILMENAGQCTAQEVTGERILVICGKGNNGGDGSIAARHLLAMGKQVTLTYTCAVSDLKGDAKTACEMAQSFGVPVKPWSEALLLDCDTVVDAILGIGAKGAPSAELAAVINAVNASGKRVYSIDIPSGGNADTGDVEGACIRADVTVTFGVGKIGLVCYPLRQYAGKVVIKPISFVPNAVESTIQTIEPLSLPPIPAYAHKGSRGKVFIIAGSKGFTGAAYLNSMAAMRAGCGLATLAVPESLNPIMEEKLTEVMTLPLQEKDGILAAENTEELLRTAERYDAVLCGSGLTQHEDIFTIVSALVTRNTKPLVLDADALNVLQGHTDLLKQKNCDIILTPHIGEMARLTGLSIRQVEADTVGVAQRFAAEYTVTVVLKSAHTVIASPEGQVYINTFGNGGMATAGSGDVLAGVTGSFLAQGMTPLQAAASGVYIHAKAGDYAAEQVGCRAVMASDILENLAKAEDTQHVS